MLGKLAENFRRLLQMLIDFIEADIRIDMNKLVSKVWHLFILLGKLCWNYIMFTKG